MMLSILGYIPKALFVYAMKVLCFPLAFLICLFIYQEEESTVTGYPSQFPGMKRDHIIPLFKGFSTFDDCADAFWYSGRLNAIRFFGWKLFRWKIPVWAPFLFTTQHDYDNSRFLRYVCRLLWMWRNPCYGFAHDLGFNQHGMVITTHANQDALWKSGVNSYSLWTARNTKGQKAFLLQVQYYFFKQRCIEIVLGYKIPWDNDPDNKAMLAARFSPFKSYPRTVPAYA